MFAAARLHVAGCAALGAALRAAHSPNAKATDYTDDFRVSRGCLLQAVRTDCAQYIFGGSIWLRMRL